MSRYSFLLSRRWAGIAALAVVAMLACLALGYWQLTRYRDKAEQVDLVAANYDAAPVALADLIASPASSLAGGDVWRPVALTGRYVGPMALLLPQRPVQGSPADHAIALFAADAPGGGTWLLAVNRGWVRTDEFADHSAALELPAGEVALTVRLRLAEPATERSPGPGQVYAIEPGQVLRATMAALPDAGPSAGVDLTSADLITGTYGVLASEDGAPVAALAAPLRPSASLGSHLSYTLQWWVFAIGAVIGAIVLARREAAEREPTLPSSPSSPSSHVPPKGAAGAPAPRLARRRRISAEDEEDALIDAQLRGDPEPGSRRAPRDQPTQASETNSA